MTKKLLVIFVGLIFLTVVLFVGTPFEFLNATTDIVATDAIIVLFLVIFIVLYRKIRQLGNKILKWTTFGLLAILAIPYLLIGIWTATINSDNYPKWQDLFIYTNDKNEKVISQWRRTSGSIYDYRDRKIIADYGQIRISLDYNVKELKGVWKEYDKRDNTIKMINFDKKEYDNH
ncbi:MAG TPA: hypothetical protein PLP27_06150 [Crocinitomicaceae bacterium]|nr:hypothetical protein [Crocinitomicaceae bacterium]